MFRLLEDAGFQQVRSAVVPRFRFRKQATQNSAEAYGVKAVLFTAVRPAGVR
jgi:hypothetical protein